MMKKKEFYKLKNRIAFIALLVILVITVILMVHSLKSVDENENPTIDNAVAEESIEQLSREETDWKLILVNRDHYIPADYEVELTELSNGVKVDSRIYPYLQEMLNDARAQGYGLLEVDIGRRKNSNKSWIEE